MNTNYVAFEGVDGSGKTSYIEALSSHLEKKSIDFKVVREPGGSKLGEGIRDLVRSRGLGDVYKRQLFIPHMSHFSIG